MLSTISSTEIPTGKTGAERQRAYRQRDPQRWKDRRTKYRREQSKWDTDAEYLGRPVVAWDGEGYNVRGRHEYVMLYGKTSDGQRFGASDKIGLSTATCFDLLLDAAAKTPGHIHIIYGGSYDANMMMRDIDRETLEKLHKGKLVQWQGYRIRWRKGKVLYLARVGKKGMTLYDVVSFFQCAFVKACDDYLGTDYAGRDMLIANKTRRGSFTAADLAEITEYNDLELDLLLRLFVELRLRLNRVHLRPRRWDGPGAVAESLLQREGVKPHLVESPPAVAEAARYAYAGGRFEVVRFGSVSAPAYEYDVNSAYPSAMRDMPSLANGRWEHHSGDPGQLPFALYHVEWHGVDSAIPGPLFRRGPNGTVCYPLHVTGWYWSPEIAVLREYVKRHPGKYRILEVWEFRARSDIKPFAFIEPLYLKRQALKKAGDGAHVGLKLGLNSLYGKMAQQVGARILADGTLKIPPFHRLEYAGYVTSHCRATVLRAALPDLESVIAFETDAVFVSAPLQVPVGNRLGEFERIAFARLTYAQSGLYFGVTDSGKIIEKTRGVDRGSLHEAAVLDAMGRRLAVDRKAAATLTRFIGIGVALMQGMHKWRTWERMEKSVSVEPIGKRLHVECDACDGDGIAPGAWHETFCPFLTHEHSAEFPVLWINPDPDMAELEELRNAETDFDGF